MNYLCLEHLTIGEKLSEDTDGWNISDMVEECAYQLSCYYEDGHACGDMRYSYDAEERRAWVREVGRLKRFIAAYEPFTNGVNAVSGH